MNDRANRAIGFVPTTSEADNEREEDRDRRDPPCGDCVACRPDDTSDDVDEDVT